MGLVYDINTAPLPWQSNTANWFDSAFLFDGVSEFNNALVEAFQGIEKFDPAGNLVEDWIIRGQTYVNDYYIWYGSYRAYFSNLYAAGSGGIAWDGFVCIMRAYNAVKGGQYDPRVGADPPPGYVEPTGPFDIPTRAVYMIPMRLPYQLPPGAADSVSINNDSEPGVYGVNIATGLGQLYGSEVISPPPNPDYVVNDSRRSPKIGIGLVGTQRTYTGNSTPTGISYVGWGNIINLEYDPNSYAQGNLVDPQMQGSPMMLNWAEAWGWKKASFYNNAGVGQPNLTLFIPRNDGIINMESNTTRWVEPGSIPSGEQTDALLYSGGDGHIITKVYDLKWSADTVNFNNPKGTGIGTMCGQVAEFAGGVLQNFQPFFAGWKSVYTGDLPSYSYGKYGTTFGGYPDGRPCNIKVGVASRSAGIGDFIVPTDVTINLTAGAFANTITQALPDNTVDTYLNTFLVGINNAVIGGVKQCVVYGANSPDIIYGNGFPSGAGGKEYCLAPVAYAGGQFITETGLDMPSTAGGTPMWVGAVFQNQTLDLEYEELSTGKASFQNAAEEIALGGSPTYVIDDDLVESNNKDFTIPITEKTSLSLAGVGLGNSGNCYIPGVNQETPSQTDPYANLANGLLAYQPGAGPYALIYDFGTISTFPVAFSNPLQLTITGSGTQQGGEMNKEFIVGKNSTTRYATYGSWDNDRDQWIFTFCDPVNGAGNHVSQFGFWISQQSSTNFLRPDRKSTRASKK